MSGGHQFYAFHRDCAGGTAGSAQAAADTTGLVLDDRALLAAVGHAPIPREERALQLFVATQVGGVHQPQAVFGADIGATAAEDALVAIKHRTDMTFQAPIRLQPRVGFGIIFLHLSNPDAPVQRQRRWRTADELLVIGLHPILERVVNRHARLARLGGHAAREEFRDGIRRLLAFGNGGDDDSWPERDVAAGKHIRPRRGHGRRIGLQRAARRHFQIVFGTNPAKFGRLADGEHDGVTIHRLFTAFNELRAEPAVLVEHAAGLDQFDTGNFAIAAENTFGPETRVEPDAFLFRLFDFLVRARDFVEALQAIHVDFRHALADSFPGDIQRQAHFVRRFRFARSQLLQGRRGLVQRPTQFRLAHPRKLFRLADHRARHVESNVAAADDDDFAAERDAETEVDVEQKFNGPQHAVELHTLRSEEHTSELQ